jgi:hypothetical protein
MRAGIGAGVLMALAAPAQAAFDPVDFFRGRTQGEGTLKILFQPAKTLRVDSLGFADKDGTLVIRQVIDEPGKSARTRYWRLKQIAPGRFAGTLTDAASPVRIEQNGDAVRIRYRAKDNLNFDQTLTPSGPRTVRNRMTIKRFGLVVARVDETIRKLD